ncbi:unnamed protein product [Rhizoctonia solani]|uniref:Uncharacterized protein n=1 Tax=Rhizoctonia solani TaxID=456999 RepID=A0A8H2XN87_9AGAM|nr:unnamed protein product [Rhizoctonia solani]
MTHVIKVVERLRILGADWLRRFEPNKGPNRSSAPKNLKRPCCQCAPLSPHPCCIRLKHFLPMPSYAGFYVTPQDWNDWVRPRSDQPANSAATAERFIEEALREKKLGKFFAAEMVPTPPSEPGEFADGVMVCRRWSKKRKYLSQRVGSKLDFNGQQVLERAIGLKTTEWRTIWSNDDATKPPYEAEFLQPKVRKVKGDSEGNRDGKKKKKARSKRGPNGERMIRCEFKLEDEVAGSKDEKNEKDTNHTN